MENQDILVETIIEALEGEIDDPKLLKKVCRKLRTKKVKKRLLTKVTKEIFYKLLTKKKLRLIPGFGTVSLKQIKSKQKKIYNRKTEQMEITKVKGQQKVVYAPGDIIQEFL
jgi:nucleoid DNA-binding protein